MTRLELNRANQGEVWILYSADGKKWNPKIYNATADALIVETFDGFLPNYIMIDFYADTTITSAKIDYTCVEHYYYVDVTSNNPDLGTVEKAGYYRFGDQIHFTATPVYPNIFLGWYDETDTLVSKDNPYTFMMPEHDVTLVGKFAVPTKGLDVYFGSYPSEEVTDSTLLTELYDTFVTTLPTPEDSGVWTDYGYYSKGVPEPYMWYYDVTYNDVKYRAVYFTKYRPIDTALHTEAVTIEDSSYIPHSEYYINNVYWFKFTPLSWKILDVNETSMLIFTNYVLDAQTYDKSSTSTKVVDGIEVNANNYKYSSVRAWLHDDFMNMAFIGDEQVKIQTTLIDNSPASTLDDVPEYTCEDTNDRIFLLSDAELNNADYGFDAATRDLPGTDYAHVQGLMEKNEYWTRSPKSGSVGFYASAVYMGNLVGSKQVYNTYVGVAPAMWITL